MKAKREQESAPAAAVTPSASDEIDAVAASLIELRDEEKNIKTQRENLRRRFFQLADTLIEEEQYPLEEKVLGIDEWEEERGLYLGWEELERDNAANLVTIRKAPKFVKFGHELPDLGLRVQRIVSHIKQDLDVEGLLQECYDRLAKDDEDPLWLAIEECILAKTVHFLDEGQAARVLEDFPEAQPIFQRFITPGELQTKLIVSKIQEEDE